ncbi:MAG: Ldh family oxidoreductase [Betaproteobacteria bacterium]|nr:Ldh family oxidoreductase [Betaproteobacteria bacterium]MDH3435875.1 Ldh family oxidoreductase [Betaproteobacteria bacterium]
MADTATSVRVSAQKLEAFIASAFEAVRISKSEAKNIAELMVRADVQGSEGHGVFRLPQYIRRIKGGAVNLKPKIHMAREAAGMGLVDGDNGMGHLVMRYATEKAIEKAKGAGVAWIGVRMSNHAGPASLYASMPLEHDMVGLYLAVGNANHLPPWGGLDMLLSTNPIAVAVPAGEEPAIVLDMATTVAAYGKVKTKAQRGEMMPEGWMMDREGRPLTNPQRANEGFLLPIGGYKGYGLALVIGLLSGTLNGAAMGKDVVDFNADDTSVTNTGHVIVAINVEAFQPVAEFKRQMDTLIRDLRGSKRLPGVDRIRLPGEGSHAARAERAKNGIPLPAPLLASLNQLAGQLKVPPLA